MRHRPIIPLSLGILACALSSCGSPGRRSAPAVEIVAHRGNSSEAPENTLAAVRSALDLDPPPAWIEIDVHLSAEGRPVVIHDATLARTCGRPGTVAELTVPELSEVRAGHAAVFGEGFAAERIPTLEQVLDAVLGSGTRLMIEVKVHGGGAPVARLLSERGEVEHHLVASFYPDVLVDASLTCPSLRTLLLASEPGPEHVELARRIGAPILGAGHAAVDPELVSHVRAAGLALWVWTVDDPGRARDLVELGAEALITNRPGPLATSLVHGRRSGGSARTGPDDSAVGD